MLAQKPLTVSQIITKLNFKRTRLTTLAACLTGEVALRGGEEHVGLLQAMIFFDAPFAPMMVVIPAGRFTMGSPEEEAGHRKMESPPREVTIDSPFAIAQFAVTFEEYDWFCDATGTWIRTVD